MYTEVAAAATAADDGDVDDTHGRATGRLREKVTKNAAQNYSLTKINA
jgi:hypothetical protein